MKISSQGSAAREFAELGVSLRRLGREIKRAAIADWFTLLHWLRLEPAMVRKARMILKKNTIVRGDFAAVGGTRRVAGAAVDITIGRAPQSIHFRGDLVAVDGFLIVLEFDSGMTSQRINGREITSIDILFTTLLPAGVTDAEAAAERKREPIDVGNPINCQCLGMNTPAGTVFADADPPPGDHQDLERVDFRLTSRPAADHTPPDR